MVLIVAPQQTVPDFEHEYHTVIVDSTDQSSPTNAYTTFLPTPPRKCCTSRINGGSFQYSHFKYAAHSYLHRRTPNILFTTCKS